MCVYHPHEWDLLHLLCLVFLVDADLVRPHDHTMLSGAHVFQGPCEGCCNLQLTMLERYCVVKDGCAPDIAQCGKPHRSPCNKRNGMVGLPPEGEGSPARVCWIVERLSILLLSCRMREVDADCM